MITNLVQIKCSVLNYLSWRILIDSCDQVSVSRERQETKWKDILRCKNSSKRNRENSVFMSVTGNQRGEAECLLCGSVLSAKSMTKKEEKKVSPFQRSKIEAILNFTLFFSLFAPRRDQGVSGQPVSIVVEGVQVTLPSYEEAVSHRSTSSSSAPGSESRVQIVLSEGQHATSPEAGPSRPSSLKQQHSEMAVVHPAPPPSTASSPSPSWVLEHADTSSPSYSHRRTSADSDQHCLSLDFEADFPDGELWDFFF